MLLISCYILSMFLSISHSFKDDSSHQFGILMPLFERTAYCYQKREQGFELLLDLLNLDCQFFSLSDHFEKQLQQFIINFIESRRISGVILDRVNDLLVSLDH